MSNDDWYPCVGDGWRALLETYLGFLEAFDCIKVADVKEKWGGLRIYFDHDPECECTVWEMAHDTLGIIERISLRTCERCGRYGKQRTEGWVKTLCDECHQEQT